MNERYFACDTCKLYQNAGYRRCYWTLEHPGIVQRGMHVSVDAVLAAEKYWSGGQEAEWLQILLPKVHQFLVAHRTHTLVYGEDEDLFDFDRNTFFDWMYAELDPSELLPRDFFERLKLTDWTSVVAYVSQQEQKPWWWGQPELQAEAQARFESLVNSKNNVSNKLM